MKITLSNVLFFLSRFLLNNKASGVQVLPVSESGFNPYLTLVVTHNTIKSDRKMVEAFFKATQTAWAQYLKSPASTNVFYQ